MRIFSRGIPYGYMAVPWADVGVSILLLLLVIDNPCHLWLPPGGIIGGGTALLIFHHYHLCRRNFLATPPSPLPLRSSPAPLSFPWWFKYP